MRSLLTAFAVLLIPVVALAGNAAPKLYLEVYRFEEHPTVPGPVPDYVCIHRQPNVGALPCYVARLPFNFYVVPVHVASLDHPICPSKGAACVGYGGFLGLVFGVNSSGTGTLTFMTFYACPGFMRFPSYAGEPEACGASSTNLCHDWYDHPGYLVYLNQTSTTARYLNVTASADCGFTRVINCHNQYDLGTAYGGNPGGVQIGGTQSVACYVEYTPVEETTWGAIKGLFK